MPGGVMHSRSASRREGKAAAITPAILVTMTNAEAVIADGQYGMPSHRFLDIY